MPVYVYIHYNKIKISSTLVLRVPLSLNSKEIQQSYSRDLMNTRF
jgi:hypothetical protein